MAEDHRSKRSAKRPAWMEDEMMVDPAEVEPEVRLPRPPARRAHEMPGHMVPPHHEVFMHRPLRPTGRMCSNPQCKNPYDSPQWRRGPLGPGTLCNACGTRYARLQAKMNGDKKGKLRPQERLEWEAFEQQRLNPTPPTHVTWRKQMQHLVQMEQQQQYYAQEDGYGGYEDSDYGYDERSYGSQQQQQQGAYRQEQYYGAYQYEEVVQDPAVSDQGAMHEGQLAYGEGMPDSPSGGSRAAIAAAAAAAAAVAAAGAARPSSRLLNRAHLPAAEAATDSQEDEAAAYQGPAAGAAGGAGAGGGSPVGPSLLHLLAVGEAISKTEGVASQDRHAAYTEVVGKGMGSEQERPTARTQAGEAAQGVKRSRFALEAEEQQGTRAPATSEPTALQRALERCATQAAPQRSKAAAAAGREHGVAADRQYERLLAEAEAVVRACSVSPCMLKGVPGPGASPTYSMPAARPITPLQLGVSAVGAGDSRGGLSRSLLGVDMLQQEGQHGIANLVLPGAAMPRRPGSAAAAAAASAGNGRGRHSSLAQVLAAAVATTGGDGPDDDADAAAGLQDSPNSQFAGSVAASTGHRGDGDMACSAAAADVDAPFAAHNAAAGDSLPIFRGRSTGSRLGPHQDLSQEQIQAFLNMRGAAAPCEPSPVSKMLMADEELSPSSLLMQSGRPRKQARTQGFAAAAAGLPDSRPGSGLLQRSATPASQGASQGLPMQEQGLSEPLLVQWLQQRQSLEQQQSAHVPATSSASLQEAGQRPVLLACQLYLQQQSNPSALRPLFQPPASGANTLQPRSEGTLRVPSSADLLNTALQQLEPTGSGGADTSLDQLKAAAEAAQAAAATASAVAAATALLVQQLQEQARERQRAQEQALQQQQQTVQVEELEPVQEQHMAGEQAAGVDAAAAAAAAAVAAAPEAAEPAGTGSQGGGAQADPAAAAQGVSGSISRSSSSSTSAAGLSGAHGEGQSVDKQPASQEQQQPQVSQHEVPWPAAAPAAAAGAGAGPRDKLGATCTPHGDTVQSAGVAAAVQGATQH